MPYVPQTGLPKNKNGVIKVNAIAYTPQAVKDKERKGKEAYAKRVNEELRVGLRVPPESVGVCWDPETHSTFREQIRVEVIDLEVDLEVD
jgi:hypothetical protein